MTSPPVCITQSEITAEDSKRAATHYRTVCIPDFLRRWKILTKEIDVKWDWMYEERDRRIAREETQSEDK